MTSKQNTTAERAARYAAWLKTPAGRKVADSPVAILVAALIDVEMTRDADSVTRARATTHASKVQKTAWEDVKRMRSDAAFDMHAEGMKAADRLEILECNRAREDQIRKGVSGGKYQVQKYSAIAETRSA